MKKALSTLRPPPELTISDWADQNRRLSSEASAEPGQWRTSRAEYQRGIMEAISDAGVEIVVIMSSSQVGKALALDTAIATPEGWTTMGEVRVGDVIFDETGTSCRVKYNDIDPRSDTPAYHRDRWDRREQNWGYFSI